MKTIILSFAACVVAMAQTTAISDTINDGANQPVTGFCTYRLASGRATAPNGSMLSGEPVKITFTNGVFTAAIVPTDTLLPTTQYYTASCTGNRGWAKSGSWIVPTTGSPLQLKDIWATTPPSPSILIPPPQIDATGKATGTYCLNVVNGVITGLVACSGGGGGGIALLTLTDGQLLTLTDGQLLTLTN